MITALNNKERVFVIEREGFFTEKYFVNLSEIPTILIKQLEKGDTFKIFEYWNGKMKKCSKTHLNEMFEANQIEFKIK